MGQRDVLKYLANSEQPKSRSEIEEKLGISRRSVNHNLQKLSKKNLITKNNEDNFYISDQVSESQLEKMKKGNY